MESRRFVGLAAVAEPKNVLPAVAQTLALARQSVRRLRLGENGKLYGSALHKAVDRPSVTLRPLMPALPPSALMSGFRMS